MNGIRRPEYLKSVITDRLAARSLNESVNPQETTELSGLSLPSDENENLRVRTHLSRPQQPGRLFGRRPPLIRH